MWSGISINGLMTLLTHHFLASMQHYVWKYLLCWKSSRSSHGFYNILNEMVIFRRRSRRSQPLLSPRRSDVGHVNVRVAGAYRPQTLFHYSSLTERLTPSMSFPTVGLLSGDLVGLCQPLALLVRLGFGPSEGPTLLIHWILTSPANRPGLHKLAPRSQNKSDAFAAEGCCLWCAFIRRTFLVTCWHIQLHTITYNYIQLHKYIHTIT